MGIFLPGAKRATVKQAQAFHVHAASSAAEALRWPPRTLTGSILRPAGRAGCSPKRKQLLKRHLSLVRQERAQWKSSHGHIPEKHLAFLGGQPCLAGFEQGNRTSQGLKPDSLSKLLGCVIKTRFDRV